MEIPSFSSGHTIGNASPAAAATPLHGDGTRGMQLNPSCLQIYTNLEMNAANGAGAKSRPRQRERGGLALAPGAHSSSAPANAVSAEKRLARAHIINWATEPH